MSAPLTEPVTDSLSEAEPVVGEVRSFTLHRYPEKLVVASLAAGAEVPDWAESASLFAIIATATETTVICAGRSVPKKVLQHGPFTAYAVAGTLDFALTGVLHGLLEPLAEAEISAFTVSTYPTDWILVPTERADAAAEAWVRRGHQVLTAPLAVTRRKPSGRKPSERRSSDRPASERPSSERPSSERKASEKKSSGKSQRKN